MDQQDISNLLFSYARLLDAGDLEGVAGLFRQGSICTAQGTTEGYEAVLAIYEGATRLYEDGTPKTRHLTTNLAIEVDGDRATCKSYFTVMQAVAPDFPLQAIICGHYDDSFLREDGRWRFDTRWIHPQLLGDLSRHLLFDAASLSG
ncbi:MAG: nuclear transport factor 2 family protein [Pseudomonadota bacterium]